MKNQNVSIEHASIRQYCKAVRTPAIAANFVSMAEKAVVSQTRFCCTEAI